MKRKTFLTLASIIAITVGTFAFLFPSILLEGKGVALNGAANVWVRETGILILASGIATIIVRSHNDSPTLQAFFVGNIIVQVGLCLIEIAAYIGGTITIINGIIPNTIIHLLLSAGFIFYLLKMKLRKPAQE